MDSTFSIAKRTRFRQALIYKDMCERNRSNGCEALRLRKCSGGKREGSEGSGASVRDSKELGFDGLKRGNVDSVVVLDSEDDEVEEEGDGDEERDVDSLCSESSGLKMRFGSKLDFEKVKDAVPIDVDDNEDEEIGEGDGGCSDSDCSGLKRSFGSKLGFEEDKDVNDTEGDGVEERGGEGAFNSENSGSKTRSGSNIGLKRRNFFGEVSSPGQEMVEDGLSFNGVQNHWVASRTRSKLGFQEKSQTVSDTVFTDSDESHSYSDNENDDSNDKDFGTNKSQCSVSVEESNSYCGNGSREYTNDVQGGRIDGEGKERSGVDQLKRKRFSGLDLLVPVNKDKGNYDTVTRQHIYVAQRTRSHRGSGSKKKKKLGTVSRPFCVDDELNSSSGHDDDDEETNSIDEKNSTDYSSDDQSDVNDDEYVKKGGEKEEGEMGKPTKRKRIRAPKDYDFFKILVDSIWEKGEVVLEELVPSEGAAPEQEISPPVVEISLPLKFSFGIEEPKPREKSDYEKEMDQLWAEFDFAFKSCEIGSIGSSLVDNNDTCVPEVETDPASLCRHGQHQLILDEEIGIRCRFCHFVQLELKYIIPPFSKYASERSEMKTSSGKENFSMFDGLHFQDTGGDSQDSCIHTKGTVWDIIPGIRKSMYPHQQEGFEFIWKNLAGGIDLDKFKNSTNSDGVGGCVISHAPGTGKTRLTIVFLQTYLELYPKCRPVIIAPCSMLLTWEEEFRKWKVDIPFHNMNKSEFSGKENVAAVNFFKTSRHRDQSMNSIRMVKLYSWKKDRSILGVSYNLFEKLAGERLVYNKEDEKKKKVLLDKEGEQIRKILLELPGLLVLDEGHTPRNQRSRIWKALSKIETEKRIILSGTPFQNNFGELYNTLCLVRPKFSDMISSKPYKVSQKRSVTKRNVGRGKWAFLTSSIGKATDNGLEKLRTMIDPFVHVHKGSILQESLPGLMDSVIVLHPPHLQKGLLEGIQGIKNPLELAYKVSLVSVHPSLLTGCFLSEEEESIIDRTMLERLRLNPSEGVKTRFLMELIKLSEAMNEKVLIFSQFIDPLSFIKDQLRSLFNWTEGKEVLQMDGKLDVKHRQSSINLFNDPTSEVKILLASTKACSEGINLVGASRVVLLDVVWNPSVERQAISRAYRIGQKKVVHTYHLITSGTMEGEKYYRQAEKDRLSELVFSSTNRDGDKQKASSTVSEDKILEEMLRHEKLKDMFEKIIYQPKELKLIETFGSVAL
ncbi:hypothetical protein HHK36_028112 [Tetracentron sinense]|uniref:Uncharacterized protein n=1 Tax=Tetracentron sinense TaxID=13715 RepID=A0A835D511_TETSI|nr:hypothetical protein HHK36_028112 [Tetracentron sinense]